MVRLRAGAPEDTGNEGVGRQLHSYLLLGVRRLSNNAKSLLEAWTGSAWAGVWHQSPRAWLLAVKMR